MVQKFSWIYTGAVHKKWKILNGRRKCDVIHAAVLHNRSTCTCNMEVKSKTTKLMLNFLLMDELAIPQKVCSDESVPL